MGHSISNDQSRANLSSDVAQRVSDTIPETFSKSIDALEKSSKIKKKNVDHDKSFIQEKNPLCSLQDNTLPISYDQSTSSRNKNESVEVTQNSLPEKINSEHKVKQMNLSEQKPSHLKHSKNQKSTILSINEQSNDFMKPLLSSASSDVKPEYSISPTGSHDLSKPAKIQSKFEEISKESRDKPLTSADLAAGMKIPRVSTSHRHSIHGLDPSLIHPKPNSEKISTHERSLVLNNPTILPDLMTYIVDDSSFPMTLNSGLKPGDPRIVGKAIFPLNKDQLTMMKKDKNDLISSDSQMFKNYQITPLSSCQVKRSSPTISVESQSIGKIEPEENIEFNFLQPSKSSSNTQSTGLFDNSNTVKGDAFGGSFFDPQSTDLFNHEGNLPKSEAVKGAAAYSYQGDASVPRSDNINDTFEFDIRTPGKGSQSKGSTSSASSNNSFAMIAELQGLAQQSYINQK